jgi:hypothetical protein
MAWRVRTNQLRQVETLAKKVEHNLVLKSFNRMRQSFLESRIKGLAAQAKD